MLGLQVAIDLMVAILEEDGLAPVAPLRDMVRATGNDDAGQAGHGRSLAATEEKGNMNRVDVFSSSSVALQFFPDLISNLFQCGLESVDLR